MGSFLKYPLVLISFLFWIAGFATLALFIWVLTDRSFLVSMTQEENHFYIGLYIFLALGVLMLIIAFLGCCGSFKESQRMLISFFCCLLVVLVAEIAAGAWAYHNKHKLDEMFRLSVKNTVQNEYGIIDAKTAAFDTFQRHFECCGANGPNDWTSSKYNNIDKTNTYNMQISSPNYIYQIPESCCKANVTEEICKTSRKLMIASLINPTINTQGCMDKLVEAFHENLTLIVSIIIVIMIIEFIGLILSLVLCCTIKNNNYKA